ncbi:MAG: hypothetical protein OXE02_11265 [Chloroflexi bacterium]|nr:hypothetical protein [Chloroflexota bacterium]
MAILPLKYQRALAMAATIQRYRDEHNNTAILPNDCLHFGQAAEQLKPIIEQEQSVTPEQHHLLSEALYQDFLSRFIEVDRGLVKTHAQIVVAMALSDYEGTQAEMLSIASELNSLLTEEQHTTLKDAQAHYDDARLLAARIANVASDTGAPLQVAAEALSAGEAAGDRMAVTTDDTYAIAKTAVGAIDDVLLANGYPELTGVFPSRDEFLASQSDSSGTRGMRSVSADEVAIITEHARKLEC